MRLSESLMLGLPLLPELEDGDTTKCAIGAALHANGIIPVGGEESDDDDPVTSPDYVALVKLYPWLIDKEVECPCCRYPIDGSEIVWHVFDTHIINGPIYGRFTYEKMVDWIRSIEPEETAEEKREIVEAFCENLVNQ